VVAGRRHWRLPPWAGLLAILAFTGVALAASSLHTGRIGPKNRIQPNGRRVVPAGQLTKLGNHPDNGVLTRDGRFLWTLSAGRGINDIRIVRVTGPHSGRVIQKIVMPGMSGGIAMDPKHNRAYVSGLPASPHTNEKPPPHAGSSASRRRPVRPRTRTSRPRQAPSRGRRRSRSVPMGGHSSLR
jgi:hypothetical protein